MMRLSGPQVCALRRIRLFVGEHPGSTCEEIYAGTGLKYGVKVLLEMDLIRPCKRGDGQQGYEVKPMGVALEKKPKRQPHPDLCLLDAPGRERVGVR